jgi:hypothetical protein
MKLKTHLKQLGLVLVLLTATVQASAQQLSQPSKQNKTLNYGFVSPNVKEGLSLDDALAGMNSREEWNLIRRATNLRCVIKTQVRVYRSLGSWSDGAEHSTMLQVYTDEPTIRYLVSRLGRDADQKAVLYFHENPTGTARLYILRPKRIRKFQTIIRLLDEAGVAFRTLVPTRNYTLVYLVDNENNLREKVSRAARLLNSRVTVRMGNTQFIGDDAQREKAKSIYTRELEDYEKTHPALPEACRGN